MKKVNPKLIPILVTWFIVVVELAISFNSTLLPNIKDTFTISDSLAQMTIAGTLFALGFSGVLYGGFSDCLGRRPLFLFSVTVFALATFASAATDDMHMFMLFKVLQGIGSGAGWVVGNACLKDIYHGNDYIKVMNLTHAVAGITPAVAPIIGSYLATLIGWRNCFVIVGVMATIAAVLMFMFHAETLEQRKELSLKIVLSDYALIFKDFNFCKYCSVKVIQVMLLFCEISTIPLVFVDYMGVNPKYYGLYLMPVFVLYIIASSLSYKVAEKTHIDKTLKFGVALIAISNLTLVVLLSLYDLSPVQIMAIKSLCYLGWGCVFGNATAQIVSAVPGKSGVSSAMMIALEMLFSSLGIYILGMVFNGSLIPLCIYMILFSVLSYVVLSLKKSKHN